MSSWPETTVPTPSTDAASGQEVHGTYLLTECSERRGTRGQHHLQLGLEDATGRVTGFVWPESRNMVQIPALYSPVSVTGLTRMFDGQPQLKVQSMMALEPGRISRATALLPRHRCPEIALSAFDRLAQLESDLPFPLSELLRRILLDPSIGVPLLRCRASVNHHHAYAGGLLVHSTELLDLIDEQTRFLLPHDQWAPYVGQLAYLMHDIGKLRSVGELRRADYGLVIRHEILSIEMLAPHFKWLEHWNSRLAMALRAVFDFLATPYGARRIPTYVVAEVVATMDQWSAGAHNKHDMDNLLRLGRPERDARASHAAASIHQIRST